MSKKCKEGIRNECPYLKDCESDGGTISSTNAGYSHLIYVRSKEWSSTTRTWGNHNDICACQPENQRKSRNVEIILGETFYEQDRKKVRKATLKEAQGAIKNLVALTNRS